MSARTEPMLARLSPLPLRLRIAHLAALLRCGTVIVREGSLSYPSSREASTTSDSSRGGRAG